jgi:carbonic anhydrase
MKKKKEVTAEDVTSTVWNALIEENVKAQVKQLSTDPSVLKSWKKWGEGQIRSNSTTSAGEKEKRSAASSNEAPIELW